MTVINDQIAVIKTVDDLCNGLNLKFFPQAGEAMKIQTFKIRNRRGYAALCAHHLTEGRTPQEAKARMQKALKRTSGKNDK